MKKCPRCKRKMSFAFRWSHSKRRFELICKCSKCLIWGYPKDFQ